MNSFPRSSEKEHSADADREDPGSSPGGGASLTEGQVTATEAQASIGASRTPPSTSAQHNQKQDRSTVPNQLAGAPVVRESGCWHYIVVRRELTGGPLLAQVVHAAGESASAFSMNTGRHLPRDARAVVLVATKEQLALLVEQVQFRSDLQVHIITETDGPLAGSTTALGFIVSEKGIATEFVGHLRPWRA